MRGRRAAPWLTSIVGLMLLLNLLSWPTVYRHFLKSQVDTSRATLQLAATGVDAALRKFEPLPALIAERPIMLDVLREPDNSGLLPYANEQLRQTARAIDAQAVYLSDRSGRVLLASDYRQSTTALSELVAHQGDFVEASEGRLGLFHTVDESDGRRFLQFAAPVLDGVDVAGVVSVRIDLSDQENNWRAAGREILLLDPDGVVFLSSKPEWLLHSMTPLPCETRERMRITKQFPTTDLPALQASARPLKTDSARLSFEATSDDTEYLASSVPLDTPGWHAVSLTHERPVFWQTVTFQSLWSLALVSVSLLVLLFWQHRLRTAERLAWHREQQQLLEESIAERTADLDASNTALKQEIEERRQTEKQLRSTQHELLQAGKLAALGSMSAALAHEINQPLAAIKSYSRNAQRLLDRNRTVETRENLDRISSLVDRIASLSTHLRTFARRPRQSLGCIDVGSVINAALDIMKPEIRKCHARVRISIEPGEHQAIGGQLRLQQVLVNLLSNALDATRGSESACIDIAVSGIGDQIQIAVRDNGQGLDRTTIDQVFEPFFTTKSPGEGLGLGLSISFNIVEDFGGRLSAHRRPGGGAEFRIRLARASAVGTSAIDCATETREPSSGAAAS